MFKLNEIFQQAKQMNEEFQKFQQELEKLTFEGAAGGGMVKVRVNGKQEVLAIEIEPEVLKLNDKAMLQDLIVAGTNQALRTAKDKISEEMKSKMGQFTGGLGPLASLFGGK